MTAVPAENATHRFTVFTKPFRDKSIAEVGELVAGLGFDGIELPIRDGYPVNPSNVGDALVPAVRLLKEEFGLVVETVAGPTDEATLAACGEAGVPVIRVMAPLRPGEWYQEAEARITREWDDLTPLLDKYGVALGVQNHQGRFVPVHGYGLARLVSGFNPRHVCAVWDAAHNALQGEEPEMALDLVVGPHLRMVNLKNAFYRRATGPEAEDVSWRIHWTSGRQGLASWPRVLSSLTARGWKGPICLTGEYSDETQVPRLLREDLAYAKALIASAATALNAEALPSAQQ